jgi:AraC-like DNA-binding protein
MQYVELPAPSPLDELVHCFWFLRGEFPPGGAPQTVVADGRLEIILHLADPFSIGGAAGLTRQADALVSGQITGPITLFGNGAGDVVGIRFRTASAAALLDVPLADLTDRVEPLAAISSRLTTDLLTAARAHQHPAGRVTALARVLSAAARRRPDRLVAAATGALQSGQRVDGIARSLHLTTRSFERRMLAGTGLPPATLRRVMRFRRAFRMLDGAPRGTWTEIATLAGFADQSHLIRDFRQFAGCAPSEFFGSQPDLARAIMGDTG